MNRQKLEAMPFHVRRVTLPRYEIEYLIDSVALDHATAIKQMKVFELKHSIGEPLGQEVVLDLELQETSLKTILLFRVVQKSESATALEWWPRRKTDPDLLELWIDGLERLRYSKEPGEMTDVPPTEIQDLYEFCRRSLSANSFVALNLHWTAGKKEVEQAYIETKGILRRYRSFPRLGTRVDDLLERASKSVSEAHQGLSSQENRQRLRLRFVPGHQINHARDLSASKVELARMRGNSKELERALYEFRELQELGSS